MDEPVADPRAHFIRGIETYHAGDHFEAHEYWEALWHHEDDETRARLLQALIQVASAVHKACNDVAPRGSLRLLARATERLEGIEDIYMGVDIRRLREGIERCASAVQEALDASDGAHCVIDPSLAPPLLLRGTAPLWTQSQPEPKVPEAARKSWFDQGAHAYLQGEFFDAHEFWEEIWRDEKDEEARQFLQGLIQVAAAMHKVVTQNKPAPAARLLERALLRLRPYPSPFRGVHVDKLVTTGELARQALASMGDDEAGSFPASLVPTLEVDELDDFGSAH
ncbi:MAG: DUF309 domain-containing protein [Polyangiaceae bacterium]